MKGFGWGMLEVGTGMTKGERLKTGDQGYKNIGVFFCRGQPFEGNGF